MKTELKTITPADARKMLEHNVGNRPLRERWVESLVGLIRDGKWATTHQGIAIGTTGRVLDGQHRLHAILRANVPVQIQVSTGLDEDLYKWIDGGETRKHSDRIHLVNDTKVNQLACALLTTYIKIQTMSDSRVTVDKIENVFLEKTDAVLFVAQKFTRSVRYLTVAPIGAALVGYFGASQTKCKEFMDLLLSGENLTAHHPAYLLREAAIQGRIRSVREAYWKTTAACQAHMAGKSIVSLYAASVDFEGLRYNKVIAAKKASVEKTAAVARAAFASGKRKPAGAVAAKMAAREAREKAIT